MKFEQVRGDLLFLGVDGGGSKCKARVVGDGIDGTGISGPANPFQSIEQARESIVHAASLALEDAGLPQSAMDRLIAGVGLAGVNIPRFYKMMSVWQHPFQNMYLATDIHIACLGAHGGDDGAVIVAGTGSVGYTSIDGVSTSYGAHGFPFGDKGSGAWMGLEAMKAVLLAVDGLGPDTSLVAAVEQQLDATGLDIIDAMASARARDYGALAPLVLAAADDGDAVALAIVREGAAYLDALAAKLLAAGASQFCMLGGLSPRIMPWMREAITRHVVEAQDQPDAGAVLFAIQSHNANQ